MILHCSILRFFLEQSAPSAHVESEPVHCVPAPLHVEFGPVHFAPFVHTAPGAVQISPGSVHIAPPSSTHFPIVLSLDADLISLPILIAYFFCIESRDVGLKCARVFAAFPFPIVSNAYVPSTAGARLKFFRTDSWSTS